MLVRRPRQFVAAVLALLASAAFSACLSSFDEDRLAPASGSAGDAGASCAAEEDGAPCDGGLCRGGVCCRGCWDGEQCLSGDTSTACGLAGSACTACSGATTTCRDARCQTPRAVVAIAAASTHTCVSDAQQTLWCWGDNGAGQLGVPSPASGPVAEVDAPTKTSAGGWVDVAAGGGPGPHTCAIHFQGSLWCWGSNDDGQLGLGAGQPGQLNPVVVDDAASWLEVTAGEGFTCARRLDGTLWCWGRGQEGQLAGVGDAYAPRLVGIDGDWRAVSAGARHVCALKQDDSLWCWGDDARGQLGRERGVTDRPAPVDGDAGYLAVTTGDAHSCAIRRDGSLWCWGANDSGQLGSGGGDAAAPRRVDADGPWTNVAAGAQHTCARREAGTLWCWGANDSGQLGLDSTSDPVLQPRRIGDRADWESVAAGVAHSCAVTTNGVLWCWGAGERFQHGLGVRDVVTVPTQLLLL